ncbi:replication restart helicase PriA [Enterobacteriaceae endosymbiont of Neohaemonia nigricornis]|uniref:replication restart helicase PriA n=1 Tax=Enterobacteriaceae endosymbiont of Neohaemonia nigricornis TaxID=2675792 RepID=UPI00144A10D8|nr:primosomal protein N' [Enterobacteriaceae endosymbiont of Neohaemonia nigricornis]QJC30571.1 primosomal protein N' [Enterobacteriaceae endosymbiont of Neohaemonia nigricornis]
MRIAQVVFNNIFLYEPYDYLLPKYMIVNIGYRVIAPIKNNKHIGIVINITNSTNIKIKKLKFLYKTLDNQSQFNNILWNIANKISKYYLCPIGVILFKMLIINKQNKYYNINNNINIKYVKSLTPKINIQKFKILKKYGVLVNNIYYYDLNKNIIFNLKKKIFYILNKIKDRTINLHTNLINKNIINYSINIPINIFNIWVSNSSFVFFNEMNIYLYLINNILLNNKQILVITSQQYYIYYIYKYFTNTFNVPICLLCSNLSVKQKFLLSNNIKTGKILIIIGNQQSIFMSFNNLGLIIINEEHDYTYKKKYGLRYNTKKIAILRAKIENIPIILNSKTLCLETLYNINIDKYKFLHITSDKYIYNNFYFKIINTNNQLLKCGISPKLIQNINIHIKNQGQVIVYCKNTGYAQAILCNTCKKCIKCFKCNKNYIFYKKNRQLYCKYCNTIINMFKICQHCKSNNFIPLGIGTEQLKEFLQKIFFNIPILLINKSYSLNTLSLYIYDKPIIVITSKILYKKYFTFLNNTLIVFFNTDYIFFSNNFRTTEYFFQNFFNILNNHFEKNKKKVVILQTCYIQHPFFDTIINSTDKYNDLVNMILCERKKLILPPFSRHILLIFESVKKHILLEFLSILKIKIISIIKNDKNISIIDPLEFIINKTQLIFRTQIILQYTCNKQIKYIKNNILYFIKNIKNSNKIKFMIDIDPI